MSTTNMPATNAERRVAELRAEIDAIAVESAADPLAAADALPAWQRRDEQRRDRALDAEREIRSLAEFGGLLLDGYREAVQEYVRNSAGARTAFARVAASRTFPDAGRGRINGAAGMLASWWQLIADLAGKLPEPADNPDARRLLARELDAWRAAQIGFLQAALLASEGGTGWVSVDADGPTPGGLRFGAHLAAEVTS